MTGRSLRIAFTFALLALALSSTGTTPAFAVDFAPTEKLPAGIQVVKIEA